MTPPRKWYAASVCGTPLPRTSGNTQASKAPVTRLTATGTTNSRTVDGSRPKNRRVVQSMATVNRTAASPASTPTTIVSARNSWCSRNRSCCIEEPKDITADPLRGAGQ